MSIQFYNSYDWRIVNNPTRARLSGYRFLQSIGLLTPLLYSYSASQILTKSVDLDSIMKYAPFLIICETLSPTGPRIGAANICDKCKALDVVKNSYRSYGGEAEISFLQQIQYNERSFVATALSDGMGKVCIEILKGTVDSRNLTSKGADAKRLIFCVFWDEQTVELSDISLFEEVHKIYDNCWWHKGYYEITYGDIDKLLTIRFTSYSKQSAYTNLLVTLQSDFNAQVRTKLLLLNSGFMV